MILKTLTVADGATVAPPWEAEQDPRVRGVLQDRITGVAGANVPGADPYRPSSALRVELRPFHNADLTVTATASALATDAVVTMSTADAASLADLDFLMNTRTGETLRVNGTPSGTSVPVRRGMPNTAAAAINAGDTFTVPAGDVNDSGGDYATSRAEVYIDLPNPTSTPPASWPNPPGAERWLHWATYVPSTFTPAPDGTYWLTFLQLKGLYGGSPPIGMEIQRGNWRFGGSRGNAGAWANNGVIQPIAFDAWTDFILGVKLSPDPAVGWVELWLDRVNVVPRQFVATMDYQGDGVTPDPIYIKHGIYQNTTWADTHVLHHGELSIADSGLDFGVASSPTNKVSGTAGEHWGALIAAPTGADTPAGDVVTETVGDVV